MEPDIASPTPDDGDLSLHWSGKLSLTRRILAVNILALALLAGSFFYLDGFRVRLVEERRAQAMSEVRLLAAALGDGDVRRREALTRVVLVGEPMRIRSYDARGLLTFDSWSVAARRMPLRDPDSEPWQRHAARWMDRALDGIVRADVPPPFLAEDAPADAPWPTPAKPPNGASTALALAPDRTLMISAIAPLPGGGFVSTVENARDVTRIVRAERFRLAMIVLVATLLSILLSLFLARTIVKPLRRLARAAVRVRLGRAREVEVPRLPSRRDEIGSLARALSDMTHALRHRIDATEAFAADVTHELKNPLASLGSAVESLGRVDDPALKTQLLGIVGEDVRRLDRLVTDIAEVSRLDAQLTREPFARIDLGPVIEQFLKAREARNPGSVRIAFARPRKDTAVVAGDESRLARVVENLVDNAVSFSPADGVVTVGATRDGDEVLLWVEDDGPGVPEESRELIFRRFHSDRPEGEAFGRHSGLGLAIAKTIVEGHSGTIGVTARESGERGARFLVSLPAAEPLAP